MEAVETQVREWGGSLGIVIPKGLVQTEHLKAGDNVEIFLVKKTNVLREVFGKIKFRRSTEDILKEVDEESWDV
ncbi:MAG: hypothetical protein QT02_C0002G0055 [archaeon GW2011_AR9]|nr:MAG: hypothetical protein QT02_C0002G0055 [archaeon GW2011_AR9]MBS3120598.1 hypothetical protein [Candidatus Woesearchaeota archaeon]HIG93012.1 hypothetical protein [Candidatus Woesearchaeota archaeon]HIH12492.1 hypothetical protein [Candidatus Woesearchaeota archaeon]